MLWVVAHICNSAFRRLRQEDCKFEGYRVKSCCPPLKNLCHLGDSLVSKAMGSVAASL